MFNAPALVECINSDLSVASPGALTTLPLTNIYASRLGVSGGSTLRVAARNYEIPYYDWGTYPGAPTRFSADGAGSLLDLSLIESIRIYGVYYGWDPVSAGNRPDWDFKANASNQGFIDLSALQVVYGADPNNYQGGDDWFSFNARSGGTIKLGNLSVYQRARFSASDPNSTLDFAGLYLRAPGTLTLGPSSLMRIRGDFRFENTDTNTITADLATLLMDGTASQRLEVGGRDVGPAPAVMQGNFGFGQLAVGNTNQQSILRLVDTLYNGGRGAAGEPESLYLYGLGGQGPAPVLRVAPAPGQPELLRHRERLDGQSPEPHPCRHQLGGFRQRVYREFRRAEYHQHDTVSGRDSGNQFGGHLL